MDIRKLKHVHFTGIKGVGMAALALYFRDLGIKVTGSDVEEVFVTDETLAKNGVLWTSGFSANNIEPKPDLLVTTGAHGGLKNPEVLVAIEKGIKVLTYAEALALVSGDKKLISVCGVGGKGSTSSMIAVALDVNNLHPSFVIGMGNIYPLETSGRYDKNGKYFICEADEYAISPEINDKPKFSLLKPFITVVTNIEHDHPDIYPKFADTLNTFRKYFLKIPKQGLLVANIDNLNTKRTIKGLKIPIQTYGFSKDADWQIKNLKYSEGRTAFSVYSKKDKIFLTDINLHVPGKFNVQNAMAAYVVGKKVGLTDQEIKLGLERYLGCMRRFEKKGVFKGAAFYDDYAHHPSEIKVTLDAARNWYPEKRIIAIFQPHTFSRTKILFKDFSKAFADADVVGFMDIYASARESKDNTVSSKLLAKETKKHKKNTYYLGDLKSILKWLNKNTKEGDIVITMGAGDIFHIYKDLKSDLSIRK